MHLVKSKAYCEINIVSAVFVIVLRNSSYLFAAITNDINDEGKKNDC